MTRKQAYKAREQFDRHTPGTGTLVAPNLWYYVYDSESEVDYVKMDSIVSSILLSELATGAKEILPELDR